MENKKGFNRVIFFATLLVAIIIVVIIVGLNMPEQEETIQGQAETTDYRISSKVPSRVLQLKVKEGEEVHKGDTVAIMSAPEVMAKLSEADAAYMAASAKRDEAYNGTRYEQIQGAFEMWQKSIAAVDVAGKTYHRINRLYEEGVMAEQKRDEAKAQYDASVATEKAARSQYDMAINGARKEDKEAATAMAERAHAAVSEVNSYVNETYMVSPSDGVVTEIFPEVGELVGTGAPIMNIADTRDVWFTFNVREDFLPGLKVGTVTKVFVPAFNKNVDVKVTLMKNVGTWAAWKATKALDKYDLMEFQVEAHPVHPEQLNGVRSGMTAVMQR